MNQLVEKLQGNPLKLAELLWPEVKFYDKQIEIIESIRDNDETYVVAGNQLGKDFVAGFIALSFFLVPQLYFPQAYCDSIDRATEIPDNPDALAFPTTKRWLLKHTRRVITTSVAEHHLDVLWGEIGRFLMMSKVPLAASLGGELVSNSQEIRWKVEQLSKNPINYLVGKVSGKGEGMAGHHAAYNLMVIDEASGVDEQVYQQGQGWAKKFLIFGNPNSCVNFFYRGVKSGDLVAE